MSTQHTTGPTRRELGWKALAAALLIKLRGVALRGYEVTPTPATGIGPFYPEDDSLPIDADLRTVAGRERAAEGEALLIEGRVADPTGAPVGDATLTVWQTDTNGRYDHPQAPAMLADGEGPYELDPDFQYWGRTKTDGEGRYSFRTVMPGYYKLRGRYRPRHVHFKVAAAGHRTLPTEMHFAGDPHAAGDFVTSLAEHELLAVDPVDAPGEPGWKLARFEIVLRPA